MHTQYAGTLVQIHTHTHTEFSLSQQCFLLSPSAVRLIKLQKKKTHRLGIFQPRVRSDQNQHAAYSNTSTYKFVQKNIISRNTLNRRGHITISTFTGGM